MGGYRITESDIKETVIGKHPFGKPTKVEDEINKELERRHWKDRIV